LGAAEFQSARADGCYALNSFLTARNFSTTTSQPEKAEPGDLSVYLASEVVAILGWEAHFVFTGPTGMPGARVVMFLGGVFFLWRARIKQQWPFEEAA
jgi:hypothetical protein